MSTSTAPLANEAHRLATLRDIEILDTAREAHLDAVCRTAAALFGVPIVVIPFVDEARLWFKATYGIDATCIERSGSFCEEAIKGPAGKALVIPDLLRDPRFALSPLVTEAPRARFYAGVPFAARSGANVGTLAILDTRARPDFSADQIAQLEDLALIVQAHLHLHEAKLEQKREAAARRSLEARQIESEARYKALASALPQMVWSMRASDGEATFANRRFHDFYGPMDSSREARRGRVHPDDVARAAQGSQFVTTDNPVEVEVRLLRRDGEYRWHRMVMSRMTSDAGEAELLGTALDVHDLIEARDRLEGTTKLLRLAQEAAGAGVWTAEVGSGVVYQTVASARMHGLPVDDDAPCDAQLTASADEIMANVHPEDRAHARGAARHAIENGTTYSVEYRVVRPDADGDTIRWVQTFGRMIYGAQTHDPRRFVGLSLDVTERKRAEAALRLSEERLQLALDGGSDGLWDWNLVTGAIELSARWFMVLGYDEADLVPTIEVWMTLIHPEDFERSRRLFVEHVKGLSPIYECEYRLRKKGGDYAWTLARGKVVSRDESGRAVRVVGTHIDITRRKEAERQVAHMAVHDSLTGLANRVLFHDRLDQELATAKRLGTNLAVLACDLDRFKAINDSLGHPAGDKLLRKVAGRLTSIIGDTGTVARLGGDEFAIILNRLDHPRRASIAAERVIEALGQPFDIDGRTANVGVSVGIAVGPQDGATPQLLFKNADIALYRSKANGRNDLRFYEPGMDAAVAARTLLELDMRSAVERGEFTMHYQPIVDLAECEVSGFEALMRWHHPVRGPISPAEFIPVAEETGLIVALGTWALQAAAREATAWPKKLRVAVNVSAVQFKLPGLEQAVMTALAVSGCAADRLELEITESVLMEDGDAIVACLHRLRALGVRIALDDFGTGYSSLSYLRRFPFDKIKIDRSFVRDIANPDTAAIVRAIVRIGEQRGATITAEGIETPEQLELVRASGCTEVQGFIYSRPVPAAEAIAFVADRTKMAAA